MLAKCFWCGSRLLLCAAIPTYLLLVVSSASGACKDCPKHKDKTEAARPAESLGVAADMPPNAAPGECWARVQIPPKFRTVTERIMTREASDRIEIIPAKLDWVEERVCAKESYKQLQEVPAEYKWEERTIQVAPAHANWVCKPSPDCKIATKDSQSACDVFCLENTPPVYKTIRVECLVKPACVREVTVPAEFQTVKRQVLACKASVKKVCTQAEYATIEKTLCISDGGMRWERAICTEKKNAETMNNIKRALIADGYKTGPMNGQFDETDWSALRNYQQKNGLGVGALSYETVKKLGVRVQ